VPAFHSEGVQVKFDRVALGVAIGAGFLGDLIVRKGRGGLDAYGVPPLDAAPIADQQRIADTFWALGLLPQQPIVSAAMWNRVP
jgi:hypothetical protein